MYELLDVHKIRTTAYHPKTDGQSERIIRTVKQMIKCYLKKKGKDWDKHLDALSYAYNTATHSSTKYSPFYLMLGRKPKLPVDLFSKEISINPSITTENYAIRLENKLKDAYSHVLKNTAFRMNKEKIRHDRRIRAQSFSNGDLVWLKIELAEKNKN